MLKQETDLETGAMSQDSGIYKTACCGTEAAIASGANFPRCPQCGANTVWLIVRMCFSRWKLKSAPGILPDRSFEAQPRLRRDALA